MATKPQLHDLIEHLPEKEVADPLWIAGVTAPDDDEPYTAEQQARDAEAQAAIDRGEGIPHEEVLREFRLK